MLKNLKIGARLGLGFGVVVVGATLPFCAGAVVPPCEIATGNCVKGISIESASAGPARKQARRRERCFMAKMSRRLRASPPRWQSRSARSSWEYS